MTPKSPGLKPRSLGAAYVQVGVGDGVGGSWCLVQDIGMGGEVGGEGLIWGAGPSLLEWWERFGEQGSSGGCWASHHKPS